MNVLVAIFSYNRPYLLRLVTSNLLASFPGQSSIAIFDDDSDGPGVLSYLSEFQKICSATQVIRADNPAPRKTHHNRAARLADLRRKAVDYFLERNCDDYLLMLDDDILTNWDAIEEAVKDFEFLKSTDWSKIGALTLHGLSTHRGYTQIDGKVFSELLITGEANVLFSLEALLRVGNHFGPVPKGFADLQFHALREAGLRYYDRVWPPYEVQHLGIGASGSTIHQGERAPGWCMSPYCCTYTRRDMREPLRVRGFDVQAFAQAAYREGAEAAALACLRSQGR